MVITGRMWNRDVNGFIWMMTKVCCIVPSRDAGAKLISHDLVSHDDDARTGVGAEGIYALLRQDFAAIRAAPPEVDHGEIGVASWATKVKL